MSCAINVDMVAMDRYDFKAVSVLAHDYSAFDLADHLADFMPERLADGRSIWSLPAVDLAKLSTVYYPTGADGLQWLLDSYELDGPAQQ